jgi:AcrR family transcriptional regulator
MPTQAERRATTRGDLLDAAVATLCDEGAAGFTVSAVVGRAGLSNGALFRHFPTRDALLAATVEEVLALLRTDFDAARATLGDDGVDVHGLVVLLWGVMTDPRLAAVYDAYAAARTDPALRSAIEPVVRAHVDRLGAVGREVLTRFPGVDADTADRATSLAVMAMQGHVVNATVLPDEAGAARLLESLELIAASLLGDGVPAGEGRPEALPC